MADVERLELVEVCGRLTLQTGDTWVGVGVWPRPKDVPGWTQLAADVAVAFTASAVEKFGVMEGAKYKAEGFLSECTGWGVRRMAAYLNKHKPQDAGRVTWSLELVARYKMTEGN